MRRIYSLAVLLVMLLASTTVKAQDADFMGSVIVGYWDSNGYASTDISFPLDEVAQKLGTTKEQLVAELEYSYPADEERGDWPASTIPFSSKMQDGTIYSGNYTADGCGYWMDANGDPCAYDQNGETCKIFDRLTWDDDYIIILVGRHPNLSTEGGTFTFFPTLTYGEETVVFKIDYTYEARPEIVNETTLSKLTMLTGVNVQIEQEKRSGYTADEVRVEVPTLLSDLGFADQSELVMNEALYAQVYEHDALADMYQWTDSITNESTANAPGFWFQATYEYPSEDADPIEDRTHLARGVHGGDALFYAEAFSFLREEGVDYLTFNVGQMGNAASDDGENYNVTLYIVNGTLAYPVNINLVISRTDHTEDPNLSIFEKAAEIEILVEKELTGGHTNYSNPIDNIDEIVEALGAESAQNLQLWVRTVADGDVLTRFNDGSPGTTSWIDEGVMWVDGDGVQCSWGNTAACAVMVSYYQLANGSYNIGTMERPGGTLTPDAPTSFSIFLCNVATQKYCEVKITWDCKEKGEKVPMSDWTRVKTFTFDCQLVEETRNDHLYAETYQVDLAQVQAAIGDDFKLYARNNNEETPFTKTYTCTPYPGFWMDTDGVYPTNYGTNSYGMTFDEGNGVMSFYSIPGSRTVGDKYASTFYLVNETTGKYVELVVKVSIVNEVIDVEIAGEQDIVIAWDAAEGISYAIEDLTEAIDTMLEGDGSLLESCDWLVSVNGEFVPTSAIDIEYNVFNATGEYMGNMDDEDFDEIWANGAFSLGFDFKEQAFGVESCVDAGTGWIVEGLAKTDIAMDYNGKRWIFHCTIGDKETIETGIETVNVKAEGKKEVFDLTGRRVAAPVKGLYIVNGKKVMMK